MKKLRFFMIVLSLTIMSGVVFVSCSEDDKPPVIEKDSLSVKPGTLTFTAADERLLDVSVEKSAAAYLPECPQAWVKITDRTDKGFKVSVVEYTETEAAANDGKPRTATITVSSGTADAQTVTVTQNVPGAVDYDIYADPAQIDFEADTPLKKTLEVTSNSTGITATVDEADKTWITEATMDGMTLSVTVRANVGEDVKAREGKVILSADTAPNDLVIKITQKAKVEGGSGVDYKIYLDEPTLHFAQGEDLTSRVGITTNSDVDDINISITNDELIEDAFIEDGYLYVEVSPNPTESPRQGTITLSAPNADEDAILTVTQEAAAPSVGEINLTGTWNWTGLKYILDEEAFEPDSGTLQIVYDEALDSYVAGPLASYLYPDENYFLLDIIDNEVYFINNKHTGKAGDFNLAPGVALPFTFRNYCFFTDDDDGPLYNINEQQPPVQIRLNMIDQDTFMVPEFVELDGYIYNVSIGYGGYQEDEPDWIFELGFWHNMVLTRD